MHSTLKRVGCFALVLVLMFMIFAQPLAPKAEAVAAEMTVGVMSSILQFMALLGITYLTFQAAEAAVNAFAESNPDIMQPGAMRDWLEGEWDDGTGSQPPESPPPDPSVRWKYLQLCAGSTGFAMTLINRIRSFFGDKQELEVPDPTAGYLSGIQYTTKVFNSLTAGTEDARYAYETAPYSYKLYNRDNPLTISLNGINYNYFINQQYTNMYNLWCNQNTVKWSSTEFKTNYTYLLHHWEDIRFGFMYKVEDMNNKLVPYFTYKYIDTNGLAKYYMHAYPYTNFDLPVTGIGVEPVKRVIPLKNKSAYTIPSIKQGLGKITTDAPSPIVIDKTQVIDAVETQNDEKLKDSLAQDKLIDMSPGLRDILEDIKDSQPPPEVDFIPPELDGGELSEKFPFCVPFDLFRLVRALNAPPVAPRWEIPFPIASLDYEQEIVIDLGEFETLAVPIRWGLTLIFILGLLVVSRKMIQG